MRIASRQRSQVRMLSVVTSAFLLFATDITKADAPLPSKEDVLSTGFCKPPDSARPRVWWHWMNGNITKDGITKDLEWMKRVGIGGVQNFDVALDTPQIVDRRLIYMSPEWKDAFLHAAQVANQLGLEFAIASSPGWSETGGPWVPPQDAMKKLVWSELTLQGNKPFKGQLPKPPSIPGAYQTLAVQNAIGNSSAAQDPSTLAFYRDAIVLAYPEQPSGAPLPHPARITSNGNTVDGSALLDDDLTTGIDSPMDAMKGTGWIQYEYAKPQTIRSAVAFMSGIDMYSLGGVINLLLQASDDGQHWRNTASTPATIIPSTMSFDPVVARYFRLSFSRSKSALNGFSSMPGADPSALSALNLVPKEHKLMEFELRADALVNAFELKAGFAIANSYDELDKFAHADTQGVASDSIIDVTRFMSSDGALHWTPPPGRWKVLRLGYSLTGKMNHPATAEATGLEVDKYDRAAVTKYAKAYLSGYRTMTDGFMGNKGIRALVTDSIEVGPSNWTPSILDQFQRLRGYDARRWLPTLTGVIVGSRTQSDAFLYDFRRTLGDLIASEHYGTIAQIAHEQGLIVYGESLEGLRTVLGDDIDMRRFADIPMAALWTYKGSPQSRYIADIRGAAATAHIYGRTMVAAESLTSMLSPWAFAPSDLQPMIDAEFVHGVNRPVIHTSVHQPIDLKVPGLSLLIFGQYFNRHDTWAEMAKPWVDYIARNSYLLQQGHDVADVAYFYGEDTPAGPQAEDHYFSGVPTHYGYDLLSPGALLNELVINGNDIVAKGGARYKAIYLGGQSQHMTLPVLQRLAELAQGGATIVGNAPQSSPSLKNDSREFSALVERLWNGDKIVKVGKGLVIPGNDVESALRSIGVSADFRYLPTQPESEVLFVHRRVDDTDIYFVDNRSSQTEHLDAHFRVTAKLPEIWHADTGMAEPVSYRMEGTDTIVPLKMLPSESFFVVFRKPAPVRSATIPLPIFTTIATIDGPWDVAFQSNLGAPAATRLASLISLADHPDPGIKYFSGIATYTTTFTVPKAKAAGKRLFIDLGRVGDLAEVRVNSKLAGTAWKFPYRLEIGSVVHEGRNTMEVRVANLWVNRLIGDAQPGAKKISYTTLPTYLPDAPLRSSGLIGPVRLITRKY